MIVFHSSLNGEVRRAGSDSGALSYLAVGITNNRRAKLPPQEAKQLVSSQRKVLGINTTFSNRDKFLFLRTVHAKQPKLRIRSALIHKRG